MNAWKREEETLLQCCVSDGGSEFISTKQHKTRYIAATRLWNTCFLLKLNCKPSADKPLPTILHCADAVVGASLPRDVLIGLRGFLYPKQ
ncbi:hypothetical protein WLQ65_10635, partial [Pseudoalteromonas piscicida]|uniref:hypothetical protein n=1 Tax=Pseudoalteromonas piscicida TaxID=43662 RepID=UPI0030C9D24F